MFCINNLTQGSSSLKTHQWLLKNTPPVSLRAQVSTCSNIWRQYTFTYNPVSCFSSAALRRGSFFHNLEIFMVEFSRAKMVSDANFPLFKIPKQWSYTLPVFPILLMSGRTLFHCGSGGVVDTSKGLDRAAKYQTVLLLCGLLLDRMFGVNHEWLNKWTQNFLFESLNHIPL